MTGTRLEGKVVIVTGGASGLGRASCEQFTSQGACVVVADLDAAAASALANELPGSAIGVEADVTDPASMDAMAAASLDAFGRIDGLFANAGIPGEGAAHDVDLDSWLRVIDINLNGVFYSVRSVLPAMMEQKSGSLILQSSLGGLKGMANLASYSAAKGGVIGLTRQVAVEYASYGIRCNAICPGTIDTPLVREAYRQRFGEEGAAAAIERRAQDYPMGRLGDPSDIANYATYLASDESRWVTGTVLAIDGGVNARM